MAIFSVDGRFSGSYAVAKTFTLFLRNEVISVAIATAIFEGLTKAVLGVKVPSLKAGAAVAYFRLQITNICKKEKKWNAKKPRFF